MDLVVQEYNKTYICNDYNSTENIKKKVENIEKNFCNNGLKSVRDKIKKNINNDLIYLLIDKVLEIEYISCRAKLDNNTKSKKRKYIKKEELIHDLIYIAEKNNINYGFKKSDIIDTNSIIFFDLPFGQISWHSMLDYKKHPRYKYKWDGKMLSTFDKIEEYLNINKLVEK